MAQFDRTVLGEPDCLRCMRIKLKATSVVVFFRENDGEWRIGDFQTDSPREIAETEAYSLLNSKMPETIASAEGGMVLNSSAEIAQAFPETAGLFEGCSVVCASLARGESKGVRIAWREAADPFTVEDLKIIQCQGDCPDGCG